MHANTLHTSYCIMICCKIRNIAEVIKQSHTKPCMWGAICLMTPNNESFDCFNRIISIIYTISQQLIIQCDVHVYTMHYLHTKQIEIFQERRAIWKNCRSSPCTISRVLSNKTNLIFISCTH